MINTGCDAAVGTASGVTPLWSADLSKPSSDSFSTTDVVLVWGGGASRIHQGRVLPSLDLSLFRMPDSSTLADHGDQFHEAVLTQVARILSDVPEFHAIVRNAEDEPAMGATVVLLTQSLSPPGRTDVGEGEYDPCDEEPDNVAILYGEQLRRVVGECSFEEWVHAFANVCAHEVGHTLGYGHVARDVEHPEARSGGIELMMDGHTRDELRREQRFMADHGRCLEDHASDS